VVVGALVASSLVTSWAVAEEKAASKGAKSSAKAGDSASAMDQLRKRAQTDKRSLVAENLELSDAEAKAFWPLYDAYQKELDDLNHRIGALITKYFELYDQGPIPGDVSTKLVADNLDIDKSEVDLKRAHLQKVGKVLPPSKLVRYAQLENKIRAILRYDLAVQIPVAGK